MSDNEIKQLVSPELYANLDLLVETIWYYRTHLDVFVVDYLGVPLYDFQRCIIREIGNCSDVNLALFRGAGKTFLVALALVAMSILWPDSPCIVVSNTALQANLLLRKIDQELLANENIRREIDYGVGRGVRIKDSGASCIYFTNGSRIMASVLGRDGKSSLGQRAKIAVIDERKLVSNTVINKVVVPITNHKRPIAHRLPDFKDYPSKVIGISSAFLKSCDFYESFMATLRRMARGDKEAFACALSFETAVRVGMQDAEFFEREMEKMTPTEWATEFGTVFVGAADGSVFGFEITDPCRVLTSVEISQPKGSESRYIISADLAGPNNTATADNSCISVIKIIEKASGKWQKNLVFMESMRGWTQRQIAEEIRRVYLRFPGTIRIVFDRNGLGVGMSDLLDQPWNWTDERGVTHEMNPLVAHDSVVTYPAIKIVYPFVATNAINEEMANIMLKNLTDTDLRLPAPSTTVNADSSYSRIEDEDDDTDEKKIKKRRAALLTEEVLVFKEADALQHELGNIVRRISPRGNSIYDVAVSTQRKDRYSSLSMGMWHVDQLEQRERRKGYSPSDNQIPVIIGDLW